jgi:hypothetical protein
MPLTKRAFLGIMVPLACVVIALLLASTARFYIVASTFYGVWGMTPTTPSGKHHGQCRLKEFLALF